MLKSGEIIVAPGIGDALSAKIAAYAGIKALNMAATPFPHPAWDSRMSASFPARKWLNS